MDDVNTKTLFIMLNEVKFKPMDDTDRDGFAGAREDALVGETVLVSGSGKREGIVIILDTEDDDGYITLIDEDGDEHQWLVTQKH